MLMKKLNAQGFTALETILVLVLILVIGGAGWYVYKTNADKKDSASSQNNSSQESDDSDEETESSEQEIVVPEGWVKYEDSAKGVSFYYPSEWDKSKLFVQKAAVADGVRGTIAGPYSPYLLFNKSENKWYSKDAESSDTVIFDTQDTTFTTTPASSFPALYSLTGEGGAAAYFVAFTDGTSSYIIELPIILEENNATGLGKQKEALPSLLKTIELL